MMFTQSLHVIEMKFHSDRLTLSCKITLKVINHYGDEVLKVYDFLNRDPS